MLYLFCETKLVIVIHLSISEEYTGRRYWLVVFVYIVSVTTSSSIEF